MSEKMTILLLEDNEADAVLIRRALAKAGVELNWQHVTTGQKFQEALSSSSPDLIISDYCVPGYGGKAALEAVQLLKPGVPFIFYSGTMGEEVAIEALKLGATDYVLKENPRRLLPAVERALAEGEQRKRQREADEKIAAQAQLLDLATDAIIVRGLDDSIQFWNQGAERLYGLKREEVRGRRVTEFLPGSSQGKFEEAKRVTLERGQWEGELEHEAKGGTPIVVMSRWTLVRNGDGAGERILEINSDITERKRLEKEFLRAQRLESLGSLASGIAHDLNNILAPILMTCDVLKDVQPSPEAAEMMEMALKSAERGASVVDQLLMFVRGGDGKRVLVKTKSLLEEICGTLKKMLPKNISVRWEIAGDLLPIHADPVQMHQVLMNLCVNARDAMPEGGALSVTAENVSGGSIRLRVEDTGTGIEPEALESVFDPFFTTKEAGKGTGLGLSTVARIVKSHWGNVRVESWVGRGTVFEIVLPAAGERPNVGKERKCA